MCWIGLTADQKSQRNELNHRASLVQELFKIKQKKKD